MSRSDQPRHVEVFWHGSTTLGECPLWDDRQQVLYWIDIDGQTVHRQTLGSIHETRPLQGRPGSIALTETSDVLLVATEHELVILDWRSGTVTPWLEIEDRSESVDGNRLNDGTCDRQGRFWVGSMYDPTEAAQTTGLLHRVLADGSSLALRTNIGVANGLAFSPDGSRMYFADSPRKTIWTFEYDGETGTPYNESIFAETHHLAGFPDGATVDADGCYWVAGVHGGVLHRFTPAGILDRVVRLPVAEPTMCAFGGRDLQTAFVTSFGEGKSIGGELGGTILAVDLGVAGLSEPRFRRAF